MKHKAAKLGEAELIGATKGNNWEQANTSCRSRKTLGRKTLGQLGPNFSSKNFQKMVAWVKENLRPQNFRSTWTQLFKQEFSKNGCVDFMDTMDTSTNLVALVIK